MTQHAFMQYEHGDTVFRWHGGAYIDVGAFWSIEGQHGVDGDDFHAYAVINVWDYANDVPRIACTLDAFQDRCEQYIEDQEDDES